jgi:hypothetical protein
MSFSWLLPFKTFVCVPVIAMERSASPVEIHGIGDVTLSS